MVRSEGKVYSTAHDAAHQPMCSLSEHMSCRSCINDDEQRMIHLKVTPKLLPLASDQVQFYCVSHKPYVLNIQQYNKGVYSNLIGWLEGAFPECSVKNTFQGLLDTVTIAF